MALAWFDAEVSGAEPTERAEAFGLPGERLQAAFLSIKASVIEADLFRIPSKQTYVHGMSSRALVVPAFAALLILTSCTTAEKPLSEGPSASGGPSADWTPMAKSPRPTATSMPETAPASAPALEPSAVAETFVTKVEFLGSGEATVVYNREGTQNQENVTLPFEHVYRTGEYDLSDPYIAAATASLSGGNAGCRITVNNRVVHEILPTPTQTSALCDTNR